MSAETSALFKQLIQGLEAVTMDGSELEGATYIGEGIFQSFVYLYSSPSSYGKTYMFANNTSLVLPEGITEIKTQALERSSGLKSIILPESLLLIKGLGMSSSTSELNHITIKKNVQQCNVQIFMGGTSPSIVYGAENMQSTVTTGIFGRSSTSVVSDTTISFTDDVKSIPGSLCNFNVANPDNFSLPPYLESLGAKSLPLNLTTITIPATVREIKGMIKYSNGDSRITTSRFLQPAGMSVTLPTAGSSTGMFYYKSSYNMTVYTDNETIKNYNWSADNVTPTFYHLDGTSW